MRCETQPFHGGAGQQEMGSHAAGAPLPPTQPQRPHLLIARVAQVAQRLELIKQQAHVFHQRLAGRPNRLLRTQALGQVLSQGEE